MMNATISQPRFTPPPLAPRPAPGASAMSTVWRGLSEVELACEFPPGHFGEVGHDRLRWKSKVNPGPSLRADVAFDAMRRARGEVMRDRVAFEVPGLSLQIQKSPAALVFNLWLGHGLVSEARRRAWSLSELWVHVLDVVWIVDASGAVHPSWDALRRLEWPGRPLGGG